MLKGFKEFVLRGNLVELAVAFIMATAFAVLVTETVNLLMSVLAKLSGNRSPTSAPGNRAGSRSARGSTRSSRSSSLPRWCTSSSSFPTTSCRHDAHGARSRPSVGGGHPAHRDPRRAARPRQRHRRHLSRPRRERGGHPGSDGRSLRLVGLSRGAGGPAGEASRRRRRRRAMTGSLPIRRDARRRCPRAARHRRPRLSRAVARPPAPAPRGSRSPAHPRLHCTCSQDAPKCALRGAQPVWLRKCSELTRSDRVSGSARLPLSRRRTGPMNPTESRPTASA